MHGNKFCIICTQKLRRLSYARQSTFLRINTASFCFYLAYYLYLFSWDWAPNTVIKLQKSRDWSRQRVQESNITCLWKKVNLPEPYSPIQALHINRADLHTAENQYVCGPFQSRCSRTFAFTAPALWATKKHELLIHMDGCVCVCVEGRG